MGGAIVWRRITEKGDQKMMRLRYNSLGATPVLLLVTVPLLAQPTATKTTLTSPSTQSTLDASVTFTATVSPPTATGMVKFSEGAMDLGDIPLTSGSAQFTTQSLSVGTHSIVAAYSGDTGDAGSASSPLSFVVTNGPPSRLQIEAAATGGFAGISSVQVQSQPHYICSSSGGSCTPDPTGSIDLKKVSSYSWRPTLSAGVVFRGLIKKPQVGQDPSNLLGIGIGAHFVFLANSSNGVSAAPAVALHVGTARMQVFFGSLFAPSDDVSFPNGQTTITAPAGTSPSAFQVTGGSRHAQFFAGIVIGGVSVIPNR
jgi:hypothetical protein